MALAPGTRLGVYEVTAEIGEGGMGQVYRGTDTTLGRQVAIKILPDAFASDPERLVRFEREAKTLASLNHPNIAAIYGFEKSGGTHALVMELVEGDDLSQRIARGALPIDEALPIAKQIAEALSNPRVSPDGRRVVVERTAQGNTDLWLLDGSRTSRFTFDPAADVRPLWSSDGIHIVFSSNRTGVGDLYQKLATGAGSEGRIVASDQTKVPSSWSADGRFLIYYSVDPRAEGDLWVVPMLGGRAPSVWLKTPFAEVVGAFSPDGRWVAYQQTNESGGAEIYVRPFVPPDAANTAAGVAGSQWQVSTAGGFLPVWRPDGKELYYINPAGEMMAVPITVVRDTLQPGAPTTLFPTRLVGGGGGQIGRNYDVAPDGRFLINTELPGDAAPITLIQNWQPGN